MKVSSVSVLAATCRRLEILPRQLRAVQNQTVRPAAIRVWHDGPGKPPVTPVPVVACSHQVGVWARFLHCLEFDSEFVCVLDDDTIPGPRWLENCLQTMSRCEGLLATVGVIFPRGDRSEKVRFGWCDPNRETRRADIAGHAWFFRRDWIRYYALEARAAPYATCGEDYHFSVALQKHLGLATYVPPHPRSDKSLWGSIDGSALGNDPRALHCQPGEERKKQLLHRRYRDSGWKLLHEL